jgi:CIC family chloride channel protein
MTTDTLSPVLSRTIRTERGVGGYLMPLTWAAILGLVSGLACVGVRLGYRALQWVFLKNTGMLPKVAASLSPERRVLTPILGAALATTVLWAVRRWSTAEPFEEYVEAVRFQGGRIPFASTLWRTVSSAFSVASGAAIGREGSMIQFAAAVTSWVAARSPLRSISLSRQVAYGAAAAIAAAYQAPIAGVFFAVEIVLGEWVWEEIPQLLIASLTGWIASRTILGGGPLFSVMDMPPFSRNVLWALPLALVFGLAGPAYQTLLRSLRFASRWPLALVWSGFVVGALSLLHPAVWGNGDVALLRTLQSAPSLSSVTAILLLRLVATTFCVGTGTVGGVFTPTLFVGAAAGLVAGHLVPAAQPVFLAIVGMSTLLAAATHAPIMAGLMAVELTGQWHLLPLLLILNVLSWHIARTISARSLYAIATPTPTDYGFGILHKSLKWSIAKDKGDSCEYVTRAL